MPGMECLKTFKKRTELVNPQHERVINDVSLGAEIDGFGHSGGTRTVTKICVSGTVAPNSHEQQPPKKQIAH